MKQLRIVDIEEDRQIGNHAKSLSALVNFARKECYKISSVYDVVQEEAGQPDIRIGLDEVYLAYDEGDCPEDLDFF